MRIVRVFVSSPGDSENERKRVVRVMERLNAAFAGTVRFLPVLWEERFYSAHDGFQQQIERSTDCDIVIAILRGRLGTPLPPDFMARLPDGEQLSDPAAYQSGTAYEILSAIAARRHGAALPDIFVFRYPHNPVVGLDDENRAEIEAQWQKLKNFAEQVFVSTEGHFRGAYQTFSSTDDFETQAEGALRQWMSENVLKDRAVVWPTAIKGSPFRGLEPFGAKHAEVFYGRDGDRGRALDRLKDAAEAGFPFLAIIGPSGAGKSSFARAGILPWLAKAGAVTGVGVWRTAVMRPSDHPNGAIASLARHLFDDEKDITESETGRPIALPELTVGDNATPQALAGLFSVFARGKFEQVEDFESAGRAALAPIEKALKSIAEAERKAWGSEKETPARLLLVIDQLEEMFAPGVDATARAAFARLIERMARSGLVWIVATLRAEFYEAFLKSPLARLASPEIANMTRRLELTFDLLPPGLSEMAEIVRGPARAAGLDWETDPVSRERLDDRLLTDIDRPDLLPLVQFVLEQIYEQREQKDGAITLTFDAYRALGTLDGAIDKAAEKALSQLGPAEQAALPRLLRALVAYARPASGSGNSAVALIQAQRKITAHDEASTRLVDALTEARILVSGNDPDKAPIVALAHQRVIEAWQRAQKIVAESESLLRVRDEVEEARRRWIESGQRRDRLIPAGLPLSEAENASSTLGDELPAETSAYIQKSGRAARLRQTLTAVAAAVFLLVAGVAGWQWLEANTQRIEAQRQKEVAVNNAAEALAQKKVADANQSAALAALGETRLTTNPADALKLALASWPRDRTTDVAPPKNAFSVIRKAIPNAFERKVAVGHTDRVNHVELSPDGSTILTDSGDGTARTWDAVTGQPKAVFDAKVGRILHAHFSPDGRRVATTGYDGIARIWDVETGQASLELRGHTQEIMDVRFSPDGRRLVTASFDQTARIWDAADGHEIAVLKGHQDAVHDAAFSPDGTLIVTVSGSAGHSNAPAVGIWDAATGTLKSMISGPRSALWSIVFSPDGKTILTYSSYASFGPTGQEIEGEREDFTARIFDLSTARQIVEMRGHIGSIQSALFSPSGRHVVTASADGTVRLWDASNGDLQGGFQGEKRNSRFNYAAFSADETKIIASSVNNDDASIYVWSTSGANIAALRGHTEGVLQALFFANDSKIVSVSLDRTMRIWDATSFMPSVRSYHAKEIEELQYSRDGSRLLTMSEDGTAKLIDVENDTELAKFDAAGSAALTKSASRVVTCGGDGSASVSDTATSQVLYTLDNSSTNSSCVFAVSNGGRTIAKSNKDGGVDLFDLEKGTLLFSVPASSSLVFDLAYAPNDAVVAIAYLDGSVGLLDVDKKAVYATLNGLGSIASSMHFSADSVRLVTASGSHGARIWDVAAGALLKVLHGQWGTADNAEFSPDGRFVLTSAGDNTARIYDASTGAQLVVMHPDQLIKRVYFSPSGRLVLSVPWFGVPQVFDATTGTMLFKLWRGASAISGSPRLTTAIFQPDEKHVAVGYKDGSVATWNLAEFPRGSIFQIGCGLLADTGMDRLAGQIGLGHVAPICTGSEPAPEGSILLEPALEALKSGGLDDALNEAWNLLFTADFAGVGPALDPVLHAGDHDQIVEARLIRAHALLLAGKLDDAKAIYEAEEGRLIWNPLKNDQDSNEFLDVWEQRALDDFGDFGVSGLQPQGMSDIAGIYVERTKRYEDLMRAVREANAAYRSHDVARAHMLYSGIVERLRKCDEPGGCRDFHKHMLYDTLTSIGDCSMELGRVAEAAASVRQAVDILDSLTRDDPMNFVWQLDLMRALTQFAKLSPSEREQLLHRVVEIGRPLLSWDANRGTTFHKAKVEGLLKTAGEMLASSGAQN